MEAVTAEQLEEVQPEKEAAATVSARSLFKYSEFLDVGDGAAECEHARDGQCEDTEHFHAWCRLPNPFQHEDIRQKGQAAKARKLRELRDPESDASVILDEDLAGVSDPVFVESVIEELLVFDWAEDYLTARKNVDERKEFEHIAQDQEELNRLQPDEAELPSEQQSEDYKRLTKHVGDYLEAVRAELEAIQAPKKQQLRERPGDQLVTLARGRRGDDHADRAFMETYQQWMWFVGTFKVDLHPAMRRPHLPRWEEMGRRDRPAAGTMLGEAPEVIAGLKATFNALELALQRGSTGN